MVRSLAMAWCWFAWGQRLYKGEGKEDLDTLLPSWMNAILGLHQQHPTCLRILQEYGQGAVTSRSPVYLMNDSDWLALIRNLHTSMTHLHDGVQARMANCKHGKICNQVSTPSVRSYLLTSQPIMSI